MSDRRDQQLHFRVSKPELERIRNKMEASGILSIGSYLRKMALDGYCLHLDLPQLRRMAYLLQMCSNNLKDPSYADLKEALEVRDAERAFRAAHTLKGVCLNLGFDRLYETSAALTEDLRGRDINAGDRLFPELTERYEQLTEAIRELEAEA